MNDDARFLSHAISFGARGLGQVWPNPAVGCVIVNNGVIVGRGRTAPGGRPHAERIALDQADDKARGATAYVSLEPCAHHGQTAPCAEALIAAGVTRVVSAMEDPDPRVAGKGHATLRAAGIEVESEREPTPALAVHRGFLLRLAQGRPMLTLKLASSFDGRIATATGESQWITGPRARRLVHAERLRHDAVLVGAGTARADDPTLTVRAMGDVLQPVRAVVSRHLNLPKDSKLASSADQGPIWFLHDATEGAIPRETTSFWEDAGITLLPSKHGQSGQLDPHGILETLGGKGLTRVLCEGGGALAVSFLQAGLVDELVGFTAGVALGAEGRPSLGALGIEQLDDAPRFDLTECRAVGGDVLHRWSRISE